jgi:hypothetical protein
MTTYRRNLLAWAMVMFVGLLFGLGALYISRWFVVPFFALVFSAHFVFDRITCPNCGTPVNYFGTFFGMRLTGGLIRSECQKCGHDLDKDL